MSVQKKVERFKSGRGSFENTGIRPLPKDKLISYIFRELKIKLNKTKEN